MTINNRLFTTLLACLLISAAAERHCVFLHGVGQKIVGPTTPDDTDGYWGGTDNIQSFTPFCDTYAFVHQDTFSNGWDVPELQKAYCAAATGSNATRTVSRTTVFTHSMGNLIFAGALQNGYCTLGNSSNICNGTWVEEPLIWLANELDYCDGTGISDGYKSMDPSYPAIKDGKLQSFASTLLSGQMCGSNAFGLTSKYSIPLKMLSEVVGYPGLDDGMVATRSCKIPRIKYGGSPRDKFYETATNHADGCCRDGDGDLPGHTANKEPCEWYAARG